MEVPEKVETRCPWCFTFVEKYSIIDHVLEKHGEFVEDYDTFKARFSLIGIFEERIIND